MIELAKDALDVGVMTNHWPAYEEALGRLGVDYDHLLKIGGGVHQHRYVAGPSVLKVNSRRSPLPDAPSTLRGIRLAASVDEPTRWTAPDGVTIEAVPAGHDGIETIEVAWHTPNPAALATLLGDAFGAVEVAPALVAIGRSWVRIAADDSVGDVGGLDAAGVRYLTVQVWDCDREHERILGLGASEGTPPRTLGETARISFVRTPDGTWIELSQRASLTGPLPAE